MFYRIYNVFEMQSLWTKLGTLRGISCKRSNQSCHDENKTDIIGNSNQKENSKYSMAVNNIDHMRLVYI